MGQGANNVCRRCKRPVPIGSRGCAVRLADPLSVDISDLDLVDRLSDGRIDLTYGR